MGSDGQACPDGNALSHSAEVSGRTGVRFSVKVQRGSGLNAIEGALGGILSLFAGDDRQSLEMPVNRLDNIVGPGKIGLFGLHLSMNRATVSLAVSRTSFLGRLAFADRCASSSVVKPVKSFVLLKVSADLSFAMYGIVDTKS